VPRPARHGHPRGVPGLPAELPDLGGQAVVPRDGAALRPPLRGLHAVHRAARRHDAHPGDGPHRRHRLRRRRGAPAGVRHRLAPPRHRGLRGGRRRGSRAGRLVGGTLTAGRAPGTRVRRGHPPRSGRPRR
jgi:hypothetical protein